MFWWCQNCDHLELHGHRIGRKTQYLPMPKKTTPRRITYVKEGLRALNNILGVSGSHIKNWKFTANKDTVYVRGPYGYAEWITLNPEDRRNVVIFNIE